jgi:hypothetical protein
VPQAETPRESQVRTVDFLPIPDGYLVEIEQPA